MPRIVEHVPVWEPTMLRYNAAGDRKVGFHCVHVLENGNGPCGGNVFELSQAIGNHACVVGFDEFVMEFDE